MHKSDSTFPIADAQGRLECKELWGESGNGIQKSLPETSLVLSMLNRVVREARVETFIILASAKVALLLGWP